MQEFSRILPACCGARVSGSAPQSLSASSGEPRGAPADGIAQPIIHLAGPKLSFCYTKPDQAQIRGPGSRHAA